MIENTPTQIHDATALRELIAGLGVRGARNLHIRDENHRNHLEYNLMTTPEMRAALLAGNFGVFASEAYLTEQQSRNLQGSDNRIQILNPENREARIAEQIRRTPNTGTTDAAAFSERPQTFYNLWYRHKVVAFDNAAAVTDFAEKRGIRLSPGDAERFLRIVDAIETTSTNTEANLETIRRLDHARDDSRGGMLTLWGNWHTITETSSVDLDEVYAGPVISILQDDEERQALLNNTGPLGRLTQRDPAEYYYIASTGRIVDIRGNEPADVNAIREAGRTAIASGNSTVPTTAAPEPVYEPTVEETGSTEDGTPPRNRGRGFDWRSLPIGGMIGAALGGWLFSRMGIIGTILGALFGGFIGSRFGGNREREEASTGSEQPANALSSTELAEAEERVRRLNPELRSVEVSPLAFANVSSVQVPLNFDVADIPNGTSVSALPTTTSPVAEAALTQLF